MKRIAISLLVVAAIAGYLLFWPVPFVPVLWQPAPAPSADAYPRNDRLRNIERLADKLGRGPEGITVDAQGRIYAGYDDGRVMRFDGDGANGVLLANTGGRPLGISVGDKGLFVADARKGLLQIRDDGSVVVLSTSADGQPFKFVDDVAQSPVDPYLYFTDASARFGIDQLMADVLEHGDTGRLLRYDPATGETRTLMHGLHFANGVAIGPGASYLLVSETNEYRIWRYWLKGVKAGQQDVFADNLPGFPDNLSINGDRVWQALYAPRKPALDAIADSPLLRKIAYRLPAFLQPKPALHSWVLAFDLDGHLVHDLQYAGDPSDAQAPTPYGPITSVRQVGGTLYFGSLSDTAIGRLVMPDTPAGAATP
ncbi:SMP-30/gluconolactonase/LRE family protein [Solimonas terrae]|uniref:Strictosidine synthase family protein n=1 Tax=Solimonas terrae TaxID=1396819 RepID=A0A6M2BW76_9GAMM|nr:SMP-30/gluconolactonase/LRE family protein [Solimonas terrae]NGY06748.1 strictosidine synthase family protein [Solimonas terrae]